MTCRLPFQELQHQGVGEGTTLFPELLHFTLDLYLIMLSVKQGGIKDQFLSLWYDSTWDWTLVSRAIGEHSNVITIIIIIIIVIIIIKKLMNFIYLLL